MDSIDDLLQNKAAKLDIADKQSELELIQKEIDRIFPDGVRATQVKQETLVIKVKGSALASDVRMQQIVIVDAISGICDPDIEKLWIRQ